MVSNLKELPKVSDSISYLYVEKCRIEQDDFAVKMVYADNEVSIPCANLLVLLIGHGVSITHAAIISLSNCGCLIVWCGENLRKFYAHGYGETKSAKNILKQAMACMNSDMHLEVVRKMYRMRFPDIDLTNLTLEQMRGMEGVRMRTLYSSLSKLYNVKWNGRKYRVSDINSSDVINRVITYNNDLLYSLCMAVIISMGYSTSLGFIHVGNINSFVYDFADLYKGETVLPAAFEFVSMYQKDKKLNIESDSRRVCRHYFNRTNILNKMTKDLNYLFENVDVSYGDAIDGTLWDYNRDVKGHINHGSVCIE